MSTEELLWNTKFETTSSNQDSYNYDEEAAIERYYEEKESPFERLADCLRP